MKKAEHSLQRAHGECTYKIKNMRQEKAVARKKQNEHNLE